MTEFEQYILDHHQDPDILLGNVDTFKQMCRLAEDYAESKVKNLGLFDVRLSLMQEVWQKWCEIKTAGEFDTWLHKEINEA